MSALELELNNIATATGINGNIPLLLIPEETAKIIKLTRLLGLNPFTCDPTRGLVYSLKGPYAWQYHFKIGFVVYFLISQMIMLHLTLKSDTYDLADLLHHVAWISGPIYSLWPALALYHWWREWCEVLNESFFLLALTRKEFPHSNDSKLRKFLLKLYFALINLWFGSVQGVILYFVVIPNNPIYWYYHLKSTWNYSSPLTFLLGVCNEATNMYGSWGSILVGNLLVFTIIGILVHALEVIANGSKVTTHRMVDGASATNTATPKQSDGATDYARLTKSIKLYRCIALLVSKVNLYFDKFFFIYMAHNVMHFWLIAYQQIRYGLDVQLVVLMVLWANIFYEIAKILMLQKVSNIHSLSKVILSKWKTTVSQNTNWNRLDLKHLNAIIRSLQPIALRFRYGGSSRIKAMASIAVLHIAVSNLIVFLKL